MAFSEKYTGPPPDCGRCPRLVAFRCENQAKFPGCFNGAVPAFGALDAPFLVVGLAPGLKGANCSGRPFTGDYAGDLLYPSLIKTGFAMGEYAARPDDGMVLTGARITNAVRCVPPQNKPIGAEMAECLPFLTAEIKAMPNLKAVLALGGIAHKQTVKLLGGRQVDYKFGHGHMHELGGLRLFDSYHCSRYNVNTGRLTDQMFEAVLQDIRAYLDKA